MIRYKCNKKGRTNINQVKGDNMITVPALDLAIEWSTTAPVTHQRLLGEVISEVQLHHSKLVVDEEVMERFIHKVGIALAK